ncbi:cytochrome P450 4C1-like [Pararge aegeria]|uniref:cytochrome P450 4C1-like n=1 Tax=Pararge aegeria TaxID=116150 RepID=UPI0019D1453B|nr:cytochrome P450 4C1-like [Pararge aegeria]
MLLILVCLVVILIVTFWLSIINKEFDKIPGPPGIFLLHNTLDFLTDPVIIFYYFRTLCNKYKRLFRLKIGPVKLIILHNPEDIETLITDTKCNTKGFLYEFIKPWLKEGLLTSKDSKWHQRKKLLTPAFHLNVLTNYKSIIEENCQKFVENLKELINEPKSDIAPYINDFALNSICETAMGTKLDDEDNSFGKIYKKAIYELGQYAVYRAQRVWLYPNIIFKFTDTGRKQECVLKNLSSFRDRVIENRRNYYNNPLLMRSMIKNNNIIDEINDKENNVEISGKKKMALLDLLLQAEKDGVIDANGIGEEVDTFMFGGHDTSANTLQFTMMLLANNQYAQEKVVNECNDIFGSTNRPATMSDLSQMKYLECCIKESLRLYPPLPVITRKNQHTFKLADYEIPAGTECAILIFDLHRRADQYVEPLEFRPERFQIEPTWHPYAYIPFSAGPRRCIGQKFAMMQLKLALSAVLRRYRLLPVTKPSDIIFLIDYVLRVKKPIYVKLEERSFRNRVIEKRRNLKNNSKTNFNEELNINENVHLNGKKKMALLDLLLKAEKDGVIDKEGIGEEVDTFLFGGHDTTANTLQFTMMALANNQEAQEKVVKECNEIFGSSKRSADMSDLAQMKYLECCIKESMRLYPPIPSLNRTVKQEVNLGKYQIPVGTECGIMIFDLHRRNDQFVEPQEFRPERFQAEPTWHPYAYIPFSAGPRNCIGQKFAMMELKVALSALLRRYRLLPVTKPNDIIFVMDFVLRIKEPIYVKLELRS